MPLPQAEIRTPESIEDFSITLVDYIETEEEEAHKDARFEVQVRYDTGEIKLIQGKLLPHLTPTIISQLVDLMDWLRQKAEDEILP